MRVRRGCGVRSSTKRYVGGDHTGAQGLVEASSEGVIIVSDTSRSTYSGTAPFLTAAGARAVLAAALAEADRIAIAQCVAVADAGGHLLAFGRTDGARIGSISIAIGKAVSAATRKRPTSDEAGGNAIESIRIALAADRVTGIGGGVPLIVDGCVVGAIGVSSGTVEQDIVVATAGAAVLSESAG